jgi:hypothetical protein
VEAEEAADAAVEPVVDGVEPVEPVDPEAPQLASRRGWIPTPQAFLLCLEAPLPQLVRRAVRAAVAVLWWEITSSIS